MAGLHLAGAQDLTRITLVTSSGPGTAWNFSGVDAANGGVNDLIKRPEGRGHDVESPEGSAVSKEIVLPLAVAYVAGCLTIKLIEWIALG